MHAVLPHTALQSAVSLSGLAHRNMGFVQGEKPMLSEEGIRPAPVITRSPPKTGTFLPLTQDCPQAPPHETVNITERGSMGVFEVSKPAPENGRELCDDALQITASRSTCQLSDLIPKRLSAFRAHPTTTGFESVTQKIEPLSFHRAITDSGLLRM